MFITIVDKNLNPCIYTPESDYKSYNKSNEDAVIGTKYKKPESTIKNNINVDRIDVSEEKKGLSDRAICVDDSYKQSLICDNTNTVRDDISKQKVETLNEYERKQYNSKKDDLKNNKKLCLPEVASNKYQKQYIENSFDDKKDLGEAVVYTAVNTSSCVNEIKKEVICSELRDKFYPSLGATVELERKVFLSSLESVTKGLEGDEKTKAVLIHIQERFAEVDFTYGLDQDTEGVSDYMSTPVEILADGGKGLDCEDFANIATFWGKTATAGGYLPKGSEFVVITGRKSFDSNRGHAFCVFISPDGDKYIIDGTSLMNGRLATFSQQKLYTLSEYQEMNDAMDWIQVNAVIENFSPDDKVRYNPGMTRVTRPNGDQYFTNCNYIHLDDDRISVEWLNKQSNSPIRDSISTTDLKEKIYSRYGVSADQNSHENNPLKYYTQYSLGEYWEGQFDDYVENPDIFSQDLGMAVVERSLATAFSMRKLYKVNRRKKNIIKSHKVKKQWLAKEVNNTEMTLPNFKDLGRISYMVDSSCNNKNLVHISSILKSHKSFKTYESFNSLIQDLKALFPEDEQLLNLEKTTTKENLKKIRFIKKDLGKALKKYGISIEYSTDGDIKNKIADKLRSIDNKKLNSCLCKIVIDKAKLYQILKDKGLMLDDKDIKETVENHAKDIDTCFELKNYDDWKINFLASDAKMKVVSAMSSIIPVLPIDEGIRTRAYFMESKYRRQNSKHMKCRIKSSQELLKEHKEYLNLEDYNDIKECLDNVLELKNRRIELKVGKANRMVAIQATAACAKVITDPFGPLASVGRNITKGSLKITNSIYPMVKRHIGDKEQRKSGNFHTVKDVYQLYKKIYLEAEEQKKKVKSRLDKANDCGAINIAKGEIDGYIKRMELIEVLAERSFNLSHDQFKQLIKTLIIEDNRLKLSFSKPLQNIKNS